MPLPKKIGVFPPAAMAQRRRLFRALETAFPVRFEPREMNQRAGLDGAIVFGGQLAQPDASPPSLVIADEDPRAGSTAIYFANDPELDHRLRGQTLEERTQGSLAGLQVEPGDAVLASGAERPVWLLRRTPRDRCSIVSTGPVELQLTESLRDRLRPGQFLGLLPVIHFLRQVEEDAKWVAPPLRAAFIFDDPNLRRPSYGYIRYRELAEHARRHAYHAVLASIPLDFGGVDPAMTRFFLDHSELLSLAIHGNDHARFELLHADSDQSAIPVAAQALRRTLAFEQRHHLSVGRVMCPPHEGCSPAMREALFRLGFEAVSMTRVVRPAETDLPAALVGEWDPAQMVNGGLPILPRHMFSRSLDDVVLRAYLNQPLVLFGHHQDVASGLEPLARAAFRINALGSVRWTSLTDISRSNFAVRQEGAALRVRLYSRNVSLEVPEGVEGLIIELPPVACVTEPVQVVVGDKVLPLFPSEMEPTRVAIQGPFPTTLGVRLVAAKPLAAADIPPPAWRVWPIVRRGLTESRDRSAPLRRLLTAGGSR